LRFCDIGRTSEAIVKGFEIVPVKFSSPAEYEENEPFIVNISAGFQLIPSILLGLNYRVNESRMSGLSIDQTKKWYVIISHGFFSFTIITTTSPSVTMHPVYMSPYPIQSLDFIRARPM
jgi:hypothetical protein